jgi:thiamine-monophosphate kinase
VTEAELLKLISTLPQPASAQLIRGIGDDAAIWRPKPGEDLVFTTDFLIEGVHFTVPPYSPADIGHKLLARGLSDIAAMGAEPRFCLLSLALSPAAGPRWVKAFYTGLFNLASRYNVALAGGDLSHTDKIASDIVVCGAVPRSKALRRDTAKPGDAIYVSAPLGRDWSRYRRPEPRIELGLQLRETATAAMDVTDGLALDLHRLCEASDVSAELTNIPVRRGATQDQALYGGEDYELLWTAPPQAAEPRGAIRIGTVAKGRRDRVALNAVPVPAKGYDHFNK